MRTLPHPHTGEGAAALGAFVVAALELVALSTAPAGDRPVIAAALVGAALVFLLLAGVRHRCRRCSVQPVQAAPSKAVDKDWFTAESVQDFPIEAVRPLLSCADPPSLSSLYSAWVFATEGHDAVWIERHLGLSPVAVHTLCEVARTRRQGEAGARAGQGGT